MRIRATLTAVSIFLLFAIYGCGPSTSTITSAPPAQKPVVAVFTEPEASLKGTKFEDGYVYEQRNRRDPFATLIVPLKETLEADEGKIGTLEGYDLNEFVLAAIAKRGSEYFALLTTPDNRSFTVMKGNVIGFNKGRVADITKGRIVFVEYSKDYKGDLKPKQTILEFVKGEVR